MPTIFLKYFPKKLWLAKLSVYDTSFMLFPEFLSKCFASEITALVIHSLADFPVDCF